MQDVDHDFYVHALDVFFDVKVLADKGDEILKSVVSEARRRAGKAPRVLWFKPEGISYVELQENIRDLIDELAAALGTLGRPSTIRSKVVEGVTFEPVWKDGVYMGESEYDPVSHGREHHVLMFQHSKKFHRTKPSFIVFVNHPWYGQNLAFFPETRERFTAAFCDSFFSGYVGSNRPAKDFNDKFKSSITCTDVADTLTGIVFIEDNIVTPKADRPLLDAYVRINSRNSHHSNGIASLLRQNAKEI